MSHPSTLIIGATPRVTVTIARCLNQQGITVHGATLVANSPWTRSRALRSFTRLPPIDQNSGENFYNALIQLIDRYNIDTLIPTGDEVLSALAQFEQPLRQCVKLACPPAAVFRQVLDKSITFQYAAALGIPLPRTVTIHSVADLEQLDPEFCFPAIVKPANKGQHNALRIRYFNDIEAVRHFRHSVGDTVGAWLLQEYIPGQGVGIEVLLSHGKPVVVFQHRRLKELPITGGVAARCVSETVDPLLRQHALNLLNALHWEGAAMVEFRHDPATGRIGLMEINGRYWGSMALSLQIGVLFPWYEWQLLHHQTPEPLLDYPIGRRMRWLAGDIERLPQIAGAVARRQCSPTAALRDLGCFLSDFFAPTTRDALWSWRDPRPALDECFRAITGISRQLIGKASQVLIPIRVRLVLRRQHALGFLGFTRYWKRRLLPLQSEKPPHLNEMRRVLFVCHGNIMRSAIAEALLRKRLADSGHPNFLDIHSAGLAALPGSPANTVACEIAPEFGVSLTHHRAQEVNQALIDHVDYIFVMDGYNREHINQSYPEAKHKVYMLGTLLPQQPRRFIDIPDPYRKGSTATRRCFQQIEQCIDRLFECIKPN